MARVKIDLGIECKNNNLLSLQKDSEESSNEIELSARALLSEENLFSAVREEVVYLMK